jgi:hypothetical protein
MRNHDKTGSFFNRASAFALHLPLAVIVCIPRLYCRYLDDTDGAFLTSLLGSAVPDFSLRTGA